MGASAVSNHNYETPRYLTFHQLWSLQRAAKAIVLTLIDRDKSDATQAELLMLVECQTILRRIRLEGYEVKEEPDGPVPECIKERSK